MWAFVDGGAAPSVKATTKGRQIPWESSSLEGNFYFVQSPLVSPQAPVTAAGLPSSGLAAEDLFFKSIMETRRPAAERCGAEETC